MKSSQYGAKPGIWQGLASLRLTVALLSGILVLVLASTIVAQQGTTPQPLSEIYAPETLYVMNVLGLTDIFHSGWFLFLVALLALNLLAASFERVPHAFAQARQAIPGALNLDSLRSKQKHEKYLLADYRTQIGREQFREVVQKWSGQKVGKPLAVRDEGGLNELQIVAQEGRYSRLIAYCSHVGLVLIAAGGLLGALKGFDGQMSADEGSRVNFIEVFRGRPPRWPALQESGRLQPGFYLPGFNLEISKFDVEFYPRAEGEAERPRAMATTIDFYEKGKLLETRRISPNHPARFRDMEFFQGPFVRSGKVAPILSAADRVSGNRITLGPLPQGGSTQQPDFELKVLTVQEAGEEMGPAVELEYREEGKAPETFWIFKDHPAYDLAHRKKSRFHFTLDAFKPRYNVTVKVSRDPGVPLALGGGILLVLSLVLSIAASHNRYWFFWNPGRVTVVGWSTRVTLFEPQFARSADQIRARIARHDKSIKAVAAGEGEHGAS